MSGGWRKISLNSSKPRQWQLMIETERENKKREKEQPQQRVKANFSQLLSHIQSQDLEKELRKDAHSREDEAIAESNFDLKRGKVIATATAIAIVQN